MAFSESSWKINGLVMKSFGPHEAARAWLWKSFGSPTKMTGVFLCAGSKRSFLHKSNPFVSRITALSTTRSAECDWRCFTARIGSAKLVRLNPVERSALQTTDREVSSSSTRTAVNSASCEL